MAIKIEDFTQEEIAGMTPTAGSMTHAAFEFEGITAGDVGKSLASGAAMVGEAAGGVLEYMGGSGKAAEVSREAGEFWRESMSPAGKHAMSREFARTDEEAAWRNLDSMILQLTQIAPMTMATMGPVGAAARAGAGAGKLAGIGAATEGTMAAGLTQSQISDAVDKMSDKELTKLAKHHGVTTKGASAADIRKSVKTRAAAIMVPAVGMASAALGGIVAPIQGKLLVPKNLAIWNKELAKSGSKKAAAQAVLDGGEASIKQWGKDVGKSAAVEAIQESFQEGAEHIGGQVALNRPVTEGLGEAMVAGGVLGAGMGAPAAAVRGAHLPPDMVAAIDELKESQQPPPSVGTAGAETTSGIPAPMQPMRQEAPDQMDMFDAAGQPVQGGQAVAPAQDIDVADVPTPDRLQLPSAQAPVAPGQEDMFGGGQPPPAQPPTGMVPPAGTAPEAPTYTGRTAEHLAKIQETFEAASISYDGTRFVRTNEKGKEIGLAGKIRKDFVATVDDVIATARQELEALKDDGKNVQELEALLKTVSGKLTNAKRKDFLDNINNVISRTQQGTSEDVAGGDEPWKRAPAPATGPAEKTQVKKTAAATEVGEAQLSPAEKKLKKSVALRAERDAKKAAGKKAAPATDEELVDKIFEKAATKKAVTTSKKKTAAKKAKTKVLTVPKKSAKGTIKLKKKSPAKRVAKVLGRKKPLTAQGQAGNKQVRAAIDKAGKKLAKPTLHIKSTPASEAKNFIDIIAGSQKAGLQDLSYATGLSREELGSMVKAKALLAKKIGGKKIPAADEATAETLFNAYKAARAKGTAATQMKFVKEADRELAKDVTNLNQAGGVVGAEIGSRAGASLQDAVDIAVDKHGKKGGKVVREAFSAAVASEEALPLLQALLTDLGVGAKIIGDVTTAVTDKHATITSTRAQDVDIESLEEGLREIFQADENEIVIDQILAGEEIIDDAVDTPTRKNAKAELEQLIATQEDELIGADDLVDRTDYAMDDTNTDPNDFDSMMDIIGRESDESFATSFPEVLEARQAMQDHLVAVMATNNKKFGKRIPMNEMAQQLADKLHSTDPLKHLFSVLAATNITDPVALLTNAHMNHVTRKVGKGQEFEGFYSEERSLIALNEKHAWSNTSGNFLRTVAHEMVHAATVAKLDADTASARQLKAIFSYADDNHADLGRHYGYTNAKEFIAEALSNPEFQRELAAIPLATTAGGQAHTLWSKFVYAVRDLLGIETDYTNVLEHVMALSPALITDVHERNLLRKINEASGDIAPRVEEDMPEMLKPQSGDGRTDKELLESAGDGLPEVLKEQSGDGFEGDMGDADPRVAFNSNIRDIGETVIKKTLAEGPGFKANARVKILKWMTLDVIVDGYKADFVTATRQTYRNLRQFTDNPLRALNELRRMKQRDALKGEEDAREVDLRLRAHEAKHGGEAVTKLGDLQNYATIGRVHADRKLSDPSNEHLTDVKDGLVLAENKNMYRIAHEMYKALHPDLQKEYSAQREFYARQFEGVRSASIKNLVQLHGSTDPNNRYIKTLIADLDAASDPKQVATAFDKALLSFKYDITASDADKAAYKKLGKARAAFSKDINTINGYSASPGPYFPLKRYGRYKVGAELNGEQQFFRTETLAEMNELIDKLKAADPNISMGDITEFNQNDAEYSPEAAKAVMDKALALAGQDTPAAERARRVIRQAFHAAAPSNSIQKHLMNRKGVFGASNNVRRNMASYAQGAAWSTSSLRYSRDIHTALTAMHKAAAGENSLRMSQVANEMTARIEMPPNQQGSVMKFASQYAFMNFLMSPSYSIVNSTQVAMITLPRMTETFGAVKSIGAIKRAYGVAAPVVGSEIFKSGFGVKALGGGFAQGSAVDETIKRTDGLTRDMLETLRRRNMLGGGFTMDLSKSAKGTGEHALGNLGNKLVEMGRTMPQMVEEMNRLVTALATYELSMAKHNDHAKAVAAAEQMIIKTHFDYTDLNKPRGFTQNDLARAMTLYKMHPLGVYANMVHYIQGIADPKTRADSMKAFGMFLGMHSMVAGAAGALLLEPISLTLQAIAAAMDEDDENYELFANPDLLIREAAYWMTGSAKASEVITYGAPRLFDFDMHSRIGVHRMMIQVSKGDTGLETFINSGIQTAVGPIFSIKDQFVNMSAHLAAGDSFASSVSYLAPKGVRDPIRAFLLTSEGMKDFRGNVIADESQFGAGAGLIKGLGFSTSTEAEVYSNRNRANTRKNALKRKSTRIRRLYLGATTGAERNALRAEIRSFNANLRPEERTQRMSVSKLIRSKRGQKDRERNTRAGVYSKKRGANMYPYSTLN